ncbi:MAG: DUF4234 domain-containing protein [Eubacterium sp.]|nr:DUF4234 domain-containing protein [Eubacterium sp.]
MLKNRSVVSVILLTLVTCGIYGLYWVYDTLSSMEQVSGREASVGAVVVLLLCIFFSPVGFLLYGMAADEQLNMIKGKFGMQQVDNKVMYMILGFFIPIVLIPIVQDEINRIQPE